MTKVDGPQGSLAVELSEVGTGIPILFLHGDSCRGSQWYPVMDALGGEAPLAAFDFRGHGDSDPAGDGDYSFAGRVQDAQAVAKALHWDRLLIVAHSGGAAVAIRLATDNPDLVAGLLLVEPLADPSGIPAEVKQSMLQGLAGPDSLKVQRDFYASLVGPHPKTSARVLHDIEAVIPEARLGVTRAFFEWDAKSAVEGLNHPVTILLARSGDNPAGLHRLRPDFPHAILDDTGHWLHLDEPAAVARLIASFHATLKS